MCQTLIQSMAARGPNQAQNQNEFYSRWLGAARITEVPVQCQPCSGAAASGFDPILRCCTYFPFLPNFVIGALLDSNSDDVQRRVREACARGRAVPLGMFAPPEYLQLARALSLNVGFGKDKRLVCPFLERTDGACTIWHHRPGVCSSYFCQGASLNNETVNRFEWTLAHEVLWRVGFTQDDIRAMLNWTQTEVKGAAAAAWFEWAGREEEFYRRAHEVSLAVTAQDVRELMSIELDSAQASC